MSKALGTLQKLSLKNKQQRQGQQAEHEEDGLITDPKAALSLAQHTSGEAMHRGVLQLQRTIGNRAVGQLVSQRKPESAAVQRVIAMEASGLPVLATYFDDAFAAITGLVNFDMFPRFIAKLPDEHPMKNKTFVETWAIKTMRPTLLKFAQSEFSPENIDFLLAVESYKEAPSVDKAMNIYTTYIDQNSATQVNLSAAIRVLYDAAHATFTAAPAGRARR